jgi:hypothetical protein
MASLANIRISVEQRDGDFFAGDVRIARDATPRWHRGHMTLALKHETLRALGHAWAIDLRLHRCRICRADFIATYTAQLCSPTCVAANRRAWVEAHRLTPPPSKAASRRAALAATTCQACGERFLAKRLSARFCSGRCRVKHHRSTE